MASQRVVAEPRRGAPTARPGTPRESAPPSLASDVLMLQRTVGNRAVGAAVTRPERKLARFAEAGHKRAGDLAWDRDQLELAPGFKISYGDMVALGDWFSSFAQIKRLAGKPGKQLGTRGEINYVLWVQVWGKPEGQKMGVLYDRWVKHNRDQAYRVLKGKNISHFPYAESGDAGKTRRELGERQSAASGYGVGAGATYRKGHFEALRMAYEVGMQEGRIDDAMLADAFACHFLTDAFSADHARVPRAAIKAYWDKKVPGFDKKMIKWLTHQIDEGDWGAKRVLAPVFGGGTIETLTREALSILMNGLTFGDLVSLIVHDAETAHGVQATIGGNPITLVGDEGLVDKAGRTKASGKQTLQAARAAVEASIDEVFNAYNAGWFSKDWGGFIMGLKGPDGLYAAERLMPDPVADTKLPPAQQSLNWQHGSVKDFLNDGRVAQALVTWGKARQTDLELAISDQPAEARRVIKKVLLEPLGSQDAKRIRDLLLEILGTK